MNRMELQLALAANEVLYRQKLLTKALYERAREELTARMLRVGG